MPVESKRAIRVTNIPRGTTVKAYRQFVERFQPLPAKAVSLPVSHGSPSTPADSEVDVASQLDDNTPLITSGKKNWTLCQQYAHLVGTVSFPSYEAKSKALKRFGKKAAPAWEDWNIEHNFRGVTILINHPQAKTDICFVHGLGGNAFDTWMTKDKDRMWPRDFLPSSTLFRESRIMTFGYDSDLTDSKTLLKMEGCAHSLLRDVSGVRDSEEARKRPLLFICHSLGGIVARKAMVLLQLVKDCPNIALGNCGLLFLATPHFGSTAADWSTAMLAAAEVMGARRVWVDALSSFNNDAVWARLEFSQLKPCPPFRCFAEGEMTISHFKHVIRTKKLIVSQLSASLTEHPAPMLAGTDHKTIAKFPTAAGDPFESVCKALGEVLKLINAQTPLASQNRHPMFGRPRFRAHAYPREEDKFWYVGSGFPAAHYQQHQPDKLFGRGDELEKIKSAIATAADFPRLTVIKGAPGIGKTELLLHLMRSERKNRDIFYLKFDGVKTLQDAMVDISTQIGPETGEDTPLNRERWMRILPSERAAAFRAWIGDTCNRDALVIIDEVEDFGMSAPHAVQQEWPAWHVIASTRDSNLGEYVQRILKLPLERLADEDTISILKSKRDLLPAEYRDLFHQEDLTSLAPLLHGHPIGASIVIPYIMDRFANFEYPCKVFLDMFDLNDVVRKKTFLEFKYGGLSLWESFASSIQKLHSNDKGKEALKLFQLLPYLQTQGECIDALFKLPRKLLKKSVQDLPEVLFLDASSYEFFADCLSKLRSVSVCIRPSPRSRSFQIHPLILDYALLNTDEDQRTRIANQVLQLLHRLESEGPEIEATARPHVLHCIDICQGLGLSIDELALPMEVLLWIKRLSSRRSDENPFSDSVEIPAAGKVQDAAREFMALLAEVKKELASNFRAVNREATVHMLVRCIICFKGLEGALRTDKHVFQSLDSGFEAAVREFRSIVTSASAISGLPEKLGDFANELELLTCH